jgi:hypothetical protein
MYIHRYVYCSVFVNAVIFGMESHVDDSTYDVPARWLGGKSQKAPAIWQTQITHSQTRPGCATYLT